MRSGCWRDSFNVMADKLEHSIIALRCEIKERGRAESELRQAFALLNQHVNNTPLAVIEWQQDQAGGQPPRVHRWSGQAPIMFGWTQDEAIGLSAKELGLFDSGDVDLPISGRQDLAKERRPFGGLSLRCHTKQRKVRHCRWYNSALHDQSSRKITILSLVEDVTEQVTALEDIYRLAHHDSLTGLPNRILLQDRLSQALTSARRHGHGVALMMLDLDRFKIINDTLGHAIGDELLRQVAARLAGHLRASDTIARLGGDEFVLVQSDTINRASALLVAQKLIEVIADPFLGAIGSTSAPALELRYSRKISQPRRAATQRGHSTVPR